MSLIKPFAAASERNRGPILEVLREHFADRQRVLEIGSGSGQHAVHFAAALPQLVWQCSDRAEALPGMQLWLDEAALPNTPAPLVLDVSQPDWPAQTFDAVFTANTLHIMAWEQVQSLFARLPALLLPGALLAVYGPFNYDGAYTAPSNAEFDVWLKARDPRSAIRDFEAVDELATVAGLRLLADIGMPANNRCLIWQRLPT